MKFTAATLTRNNIALAVSLALLSVSIAVWREWFLFSKVVYAPEWSFFLPVLVRAPAFAVFVCLLPAALLPATPSGAARAMSGAVVFSPLPALIMYIASTVTSGTDLWLNAAFNYAWVVGFHCFLPALCLFAVRALAAAIKGRGGG